MADFFFSVKFKSGFVVGCAVKKAAIVKRPYFGLLLFIVGANICFIQKRGILLFI
jgi:hypothetical protein